MLNKCYLQMEFLILGKKEAQDSSPFGQELRREPSKLSFKLTISKLSM